MTDPYEPIISFAESLSVAEITAWLLRLRGRPHVPGSHYDVGAVLRVDAGGRTAYVAGVNVENIDPALSVHGEGAALSAMLAAFGRGARVTEAWVMAAPRALKPGSADPLAHDGGTCCGRCRQHLWEFAATPDMKVHTVALGGEIRTQAIAALLPEGFSFARFKPVADAGAEKVDGDTARARLLRMAAPDRAGAFEWLRTLRPVDYASGVSQAMVIVLDNGAAVAGVRMEDSAFTGLTAAQGAVANAVTAFGTFHITHAYVLTHGGGVPDGAIAPLPLSALQVLREFGSSRLPLTFFTPAGQAWNINLSAAADTAPSFAKPWRMLWDGQLGS
jgi:cytidine deaminase